MTRWWRRWCWFMTGHYYEPTALCRDGRYLEKCLLCGELRVCQCRDCREVVPTTPQGQVT